MSLPLEQVLSTIQNDMPVEATRIITNICEELIKANIRTDSVELLLSDPRADPSLNDNKMLRNASEKGNVKIVELLLRDKRVNPGFDHNKAIYLALQNGHYEVIEMLLKDNRVDPSESSDMLIKQASAKGNYKVVKLLLSDSRVNPNAQSGYPIGFASKNGHLETVRVLLEDIRVDPWIDQNFAIKKAYSGGHIDILKLLLSKLPSSAERDTEVSKIIKEFTPVIETPTTTPEETILTTNTQSLNEAKTLILNLMELHNMCKVNIKSDCCSFSFKK